MEISDQIRNVSSENYLNITLNINEWSHMNKGRWEHSVMHKHEQIYPRSICGRRGHEHGHDQHLVEPDGHHFNQEEGGDDKPHF